MQSTSMTAKPPLRLTFPEPTIAWLEFDQPDKSVNVLTREMLTALEQHLNALELQTELQGLVLASAKPNSFLAGADIKEIARLQQSDPAELRSLFERGQALFRRLATMPFVTIAAIQGTCLGGGAEVALWCDARIFSQHTKTEFGLPEVKLGLIPGWGGTVRLPRIIGLPNALELIASGNSVDAERAWSLGLAHDFVPPERLQSAALQLVKRLSQQQAYLALRATADQPVSMPPQEMAFLGAVAAAKIQQETSGHYPAPLAAIELMLETASLSVTAALAQEAEVMAQLFVSPTSRALLNVFFLTDRIKKASVNFSSTESPPEIKQIGIVGAGIMGAGIAAATLKRDLAITLIDRSPPALDAGVRGVLEEVAYDKHTKQASAQRAIHFGAKLHASDSLAALHDSQIVIEAIVETLDAKAAFYQELEPLLSEEVVIASNTSTIPIARLAEKLKHPNRFCGLHFFNPVRRMQLVEVIRGPQTSTATLATAATYVKRIGKFPLLVNDGPGFLVNRLLSPYLNAALELLSQGINMRSIDQAALQFGMPIGPIALYDLVGLDTAFQAGRTMWEAFSERFTPSPIIPALIKAGRLGQKNGIGFYNYRNKKQRAERDSSAEKILETYTKTQLELSQEQITLRLFLPMLLEATRALEAGIVSDPRDIDLGLIYGLGFPPFRGGLCYWADSLGSAKLLEMLAATEAAGKKLNAPPLLRDLTQANRKFYAQEAAL
jgi:3-hydroxyacyl-CoA dehydrogenase/enoyl-CoA hydratase/3-hydroxybutyryl-CoA epimerase/3-hydroxyacyl-CoA dehydrogenase/enoyl-CoA hydratase/3-hydroxybutyryl-CoA epimerase/enoyl-CoA isomerase